MGPLLVLVCPCFRDNVIVTCKIVSFLCSLDNYLSQNVFVFLFGNQISKWRSFEKRAIFDLLFTFFSHQGKDAIKKQNKTKQNKNKNKTKQNKTLSTYLTYIQGESKKLQLQ